jgi:hypothetical protein
MLRICLFKRYGMKISSIAIIISLLLLIGCVTPTTVVKTADTRPSLIITGAPADAILLLDGLNMGRANQYDGKPNYLIVIPGTHKISILQGDTVIYEQVIFVESERKEVRVR